MPNQHARAWLGLLFLIVVMAVSIFASAGTMHYWQAWLFLGVFTVSVFAITLYLAKRDPALLERRVRAGPVAEREGSQKVIQAVAQIAFLAVIILPAIDHRLAWSSMPWYVSVAGDALVGSGLFVVFRVFKANTFTSATIEVAAGQRVISSGPYAVVRHPMYSGARRRILQPRKGRENVAHSASYGLRGHQK